MEHIIISYVIMQVPTWDYVVKRTRELQANSDVKTEVDNLKLLTIYVEYLENLRLHKVRLSRAEHWNDITCD